MTNVQGAVRHDSQWIQSHRAILVAQTDGGAVPTQSTVGLASRSAELAVVSRGLFYRVYINDDISLQWPLNRNILNLMSCQVVYAKINKDLNVRHYVFRKYW